MCEDVRSGTDVWGCKEWNQCVRSVEKRSLFKMRKKLINTSGRIQVPSSRTSQITQAWDLYCSYLITLPCPHNCLQPQGDCNPPGSSVHGISQTRILEWVAISFCRGSSQPRDRTRVSCIGRHILYHWATGKHTGFVLCPLKSSFYARVTLRESHAEPIIKMATLSKRNFPQCQC